MNITFYDLIQDHYEFYYYFQGHDCQHSRISSRDWKLSRFMSLE